MLKLLFIFLSYYFKKNPAKNRLKNPHQNLTASLLTNKVHDPLLNLAKV